MKDEKKLLSENELKKVLGGLEESELLFELELIVNQYPEIQQILDAHESGDFGTYYILLSNLEFDHPELGYLFK